VVVAVVVRMEGLRLRAAMAMQSREEAAAAVMAARAAVWGPCHCPSTARPGTTAVVAVVAREPTCIRIHQLLEEAGEQILPLMLFMDPVAAVVAREPTAMMKVTILAEAEETGAHMAAAAARVR
jgi:hypothetical protein